VEVRRVELLEIAARIAGSRRHDARLWPISGADQDLVARRGAVVTGRAVRSRQLLHPPPPRVEMALLYTSGTLGPPTPLQSRRIFLSAGPDRGSVLAGLHPADSCCRPTGCAPERSRSATPTTTSGSPYTQRAPAWPR